MATPDYDQWLNSVWGWPTEYLSAIPSLLGVNGIRPPGMNPPYTAADFLLMYPKFFGPATPAMIITTAGSADVSISPDAGAAPGQLLVATPVVQPGSAIRGTATGTLDARGDFTAGALSVINVPTTQGLLRGQPVSGPMVAQGAVLNVVGTSTVQMSLPAVTTGAADTFTATTQTVTLTAPAVASSEVTAAVYTQPPVPLPIINVYLTLARASLDAVRWGELWTMAVGLYAAHFITLWMQTDNGTFTSADSIARRGITSGLMVSKSADGLSASYQPLSGLQDWGAWNLTGYGQLLATYAATIGSGSLLVL